MLTLKRISDPRKRGVELFPRGNRITVNGWVVEGFYDKNGNEYERGQKGAGVQRVTRWHILVDEENDE